MGAMNINQCTKVVDCKRFELDEHPPYSPNLAPNDYRLFPKLKERCY